MKNHDPSNKNNDSKIGKPDLTEVKLFVPDDLARAYQRCCWILVNESGKNRSEIMKETVHDFLVKHGC